MAPVHETGRFIRTVLKGDIKLSPATIAYLFAADRCEHLYGSYIGTNSEQPKDCGIVKRTKSGELCISDRYLFSSLAYQSPECGSELPSKINEDFPLPEIVFYFVISPSISLKRITNRDVTEIYEKQEILDKIAAEYERIFCEYEKEHPEINIIRIDATQDPDKIEKIIWNEIEKLPIQGM